LRVLGAAAPAAVAAATGGGGGGGGGAAGAGGGVIGLNGGAVGLGVLTTRELARVVPAGGCQLNAGGWGSQRSVLSC